MASRRRRAFRPTWSRAEQGVQAALADPKIQQRIKEFGGEPLRLRAAEFGKPWPDETECWAKVVGTIGLSIE